MKAISLWQPWASAMTVNRPGTEQKLKRFETRSWEPPSSLIGQRVAIAAAKTVVAWEKHANGSKTRMDLREWFAERVSLNPVFGYAFELAGFAGWDDLPLGAIVGHGILKRVARTEDLFHRGELNGTELQWGNYEAGRYGWEFADVVTFPSPVPVIGRQGLFDWNEAKPPTATTGQGILFK